MSDLADKIRELVVKWRGPVDDGHIYSPYTQAMHDCADELEVVVLGLVADAPPFALLREVLRQHWLRAIICHHAEFPGDDAWDRPECACSEIHFPKGKNVGEAVEMWINHVFVVAALEEDWSRKTELIGRCQQSHPEGGQCELRLKHAGHHLSGTIWWAAAERQMKRGSG